MLNEVKSMAASPGPSALGPLLPGAWDPVWCAGTQYLCQGLGHVAKLSMYSSDTQTQTDMDRTLTRFHTGCFSQGLLSTGLTP